MSIQNDLKERWTDLTSYIAPETSEKWWNRIVAAYTEPGRHYHNLDHLEAMFQHYDCNKDALNDKYATAVAVFFHDIVYDPKAQDNEKKSIEVFKEFVHETTVDSSSYIITLIEATESHCTEAHLSKASVGEDDLHYFLDFDMAILGSSAEEYAAYLKQIRQEYAHMNDAAYSAGRLKVLRLFLQIPNIFATAAFRESYESRARDNIQNEIAELEKTA